MELKSSIEIDSIVTDISKMFDYEFSGETITTIDIPNIPKEYNIGLIVGASGSGKSSILKTLGTEEYIEWNNDKAIVSHFKDSNEAIELLGASGLNSIPSWLKPYNVLSTGEKFRVDLSRKIKNNSVIDEFTSVIDRSVALSASTAISKYIRKYDIKNVTFASCHYDIIDWLNPDWIYDTNTCKLYTRGCLRRPKIQLEILPCSVKAWDLFKQHHYLTSDIHIASDCYLAVWNNRIVAFDSILSFPTGNFKNAWREHRLVVLPDFQGMGLGNIFSEYIAQCYINSGKRFFTKTSNLRIGMHRNKSIYWRPTSENGKDRKSFLKSDNWISKVGKSGFDYYDAKKHALRVCYTHEYIGNQIFEEVKSEIIKDTIFDMF